MRSLFDLVSRLCARCRDAAGSIAPLLPATASCLRHGCAAAVGVVCAAGAGLSACVRGLGKALGTVVAWGDALGTKMVGQAEGIVSNVWSVVCDRVGSAGAGAGACFRESLGVLYDVVREPVDDGVLQEFQRVFTRRVECARRLEVWYIQVFVARLALSLAGLTSVLGVGGGVMEGWRISLAGPGEHACWLTEGNMGLLESLASGPAGLALAGACVLCFVGAGVWALAVPRQFAECLQRLKM